MKWKSISIYLIMVFWLFSVLTVKAEPNITAPSAILAEASTGQVIYEHNSTERRSPASITKIMTMLLTFEELSKGNIRLEEQVVTSQYASSMGGSQVFLAENEVQTLETMLKCIAIASANDASVAVAEHIAGSEEAFVEMMNRKAQQLGMADTHFMDCCGLSDSDNHYTTAKDIAIMTREIITKYPQVYNYSQIWMEDITHETAGGSSIFTLSNTNKLIKQYQWATGLKTGSTSKALYCLSATAHRNDMDLIAVIMAAPDSGGRFQDAAALLNYGFSVSDLYIDENQEELPYIKVENGVEDFVSLMFEGEFRYLDTSGKSLEYVEKVIELPESIKAPIRQGNVAGRAIYRVDGAEIGRVSILFSMDVEKAHYKDYLYKIFRFFLL